LEQRNAEEEDRLGRATASARGEDTSMPAPEMPEHAQELQRKVRAVLLAHRPDKS